MDAIGHIARERNICLIEDCRQAHGSAYRGRKAGSLGTAGVFSFNDYSNISCGEGGAMTTSDMQVYRNAWRIHNSGRSIADAGELDATFLMGTNIRMTEWQAVILLPQIASYMSDVEQRMANAIQLRKELADIACLECVPMCQEQTAHAYHAFLLKYDRQNLYQIDREVFIKACRAEGVPVTKGYQTALHELPWLYGDYARKLTGCVRRDQGMDYQMTKRLISGQALWLDGNSLRGTPADIRDIVAGLHKVIAYSHELALMAANG